MPQTEQSRVRKTSDDLLLIETSKASRAVLQRTLMAQGFRVTSVADAQQVHTEQN